MKLRDGTEAQDSRLGRLVQFDSRSLGFPIRALIPPAPLKSRSWDLPWQLDQKRTSGCTGYSVTEEWLAEPYPGPITSVEEGNAIADAVYLRARHLDPFEGIEDAGSTVLAAMKAAVERGWYSEYRWSLGPSSEAAAEDVCRAISSEDGGPVVMGTVWKTGMYEADADGFLNLTGNDEGGHAYVLTRYDAERDAVWTPNSWNGEGQGWIRRTNLATLLGMQGEGVLPVVRLGS